jgi:hypothetical protein
MCAMTALFDGIDGRGYLELAASAAAKAAAKCPPWCDYDHIDDPTCPHYSALTAIGMTWSTDKTNPVAGRRDFLQVGLDEHGLNSGRLYVTITTTCGEIQLQLRDARHLALALLQLDDAARG